MANKYLSNTSGYSMARALSNKYDMSPNVNLGVQKPSSSQPMGLASNLYNMLGINMSGGKFNALERGRFNVPVGKYGVHGEYVKKGTPFDYWKLGISMPLNIRGL